MMKKVFLAAALALAVASSWAFYPKAAADGPGGYMMVTSHMAFSAKSNTLSSIMPDGQRQEAAVVTENRKTNQEELDRATLLKLNQLRQAGWHVVSMTTAVDARTAYAGGQGDGVQTTYLLEK